MRSRPYRRHQTQRHMMRLLVEEDTLDVIEAERALCEAEVEDFGDAEDAAE